eukprot:CAMPEP_0202726134 /NCGR_PEP_ID=MMETSP1385-20130828/184458_1 /ASSEMBLY_ACC=CAM_ASM_000861 /TAXON_ID=933848 /ORGANISM="Elphidium margaritaceum" /LENGTH=266 /DNA_ID=CAMNT_0049392347 /DNA_START=25 /DNA_END=822 /DNA_ORIENTATION=-
MEKSCKMFVGLNSKKVANATGSKSYVSGISIACASAIRQDDEYRSKINEINAVKMDFAVCHCTECSSCEPLCNLCRAKPALLNPHSTEWTPIEGDRDAGTAVEWPTFESSMDGEPLCNLCRAKPALLNPHSTEWTPIEGDRDADTAVEWPTFESIDGRIKNRYPAVTGEAKKIKYQQLRVTVDGEIWLAAYIKTIPLSTLIRSTSPSGYKNQGRISVGACLLLQGEANKSLIMMIKKNPAYEDKEFESKEPVVNAVGFWGLDASDG